MAVKSRASRPEAWRSLLQRGVDTAAELSDVLADKLNAAADPRAKLLRKRRWALRLGLFFTVACGFWLLVTAVLATWSTRCGAADHRPGRGGCSVSGDAVLPALSLAEGLAATPAAFAGHPATPGLGFGGPTADGRAGRVRAFVVLSARVMERGRMLPAGELRELSAAANHTAATLAATANEVVSMERAMNLTPQSRAHLTSHHQRVHHPAGPRRPSVQRNGHRRSAIGIRREHRLDVEFTDVATALPRRVGQYRSPGRMGAGLRRASATCAGPDRSDVVTAGRS